MLIVSYAECHYADCRGALFTPILVIMKKVYKIESIILCFESFLFEISYSIFLACKAPALIVNT